MTALITGGYVNIALAENISIFNTFRDIRAIFRDFIIPFQMRSEALVHPDSQIFISINGNNMRFSK